MQLTHLQKKAAKEIISAFVHEIEHNERNQRIAAITWEELGQSLSPQAKNLTKKIQTANPRKYGCSREKVGHHNKNDLVVLRNQEFHTTSYSQKLPARLLPADTYYSFQKMNRRIARDIGRKLIVKSGYRSPAYQLYIFLYNLKEYSWNFKKTLETVALPGYSEHAGRPQALDLRAQKHIGHEYSYDFARTPEFRWLQEHAHNFGFELSYPKENDTNTQFEPWHWRHSHPAS